MFPAGKGTVLLFGSRVRGTAREDSDWDLLVVTDDEISREDNFREFAFPFAELGWRLGEQITPLHYTRSEWESFSGTYFYENVVSNSLVL